MKKVCWVLFVVAAALTLRGDPHADPYGVPRRGSVILWGESAELEQNPVADQQPNYSIQDEAYQRRPDTKEVWFELRKSLIVVFLFLGPAILFAVSGLTDFRRQSQEMR